MSIPANPADVDLVLEEVRCLLSGEPPPHWLNDYEVARYTFRG